ncbi:MAG: hypothetical protein V4764_07085 [Burkholderia sp.]
MRYLIITLNLLLRILVGGLGFILGIAFLVGIGGFYNLHFWNFLRPDIPHSECDLEHCYWTPIRTIKVLVLLLGPAVTLFVINALAWKRWTLKNWLKRAGIALGLFFLLYTWASFPYFAPAWWFS